VEGDYRRKTQRGIKCKQLLVQDCFEIVDVYKSHVQHYLTDLMQVTVLAVKVSDRELPAKSAIQVKEAQPVDIVMDEEEQQSEVSAPVPSNAASQQSQAPVPPKAKVQAVKTPPAKRQLNSSISISAASSESAEVKP